VRKSEGERESEKERGRERVRKREGERESEKEGERVACMRKHKLPHSVSQSACVIICLK
jgi:hypothetical protein